MKISAKVRPSSTSSIQGQSPLDSFDPFKPSSNSPVRRSPPKLSNNQPLSQQLTTDQPGALELEKISGQPIPTEKSKELSSKEAATPIGEEAQGELLSAENAATNRGSISSNDGLSIDNLQLAQGASVGDITIEAKASIVNREENTASKQGCGKETELGLINESTRQEDHPLDQETDDEIRFRQDSLLKEFSATFTRAKNLINSGAKPFKEDKPPAATISSSLSYTVSSDADSYSLNYSAPDPVFDPNEETDDMSRDLTPSPFSGLKSEDAEEWINSVACWIRYKKLTNDAAVAAVALLLRGGAQQWFQSLESTD